MDTSTIPTRASTCHFPQLPYGAYGSAKGVRRTMLLWFYSLQNDLETLEVVESDMWSGLSVAHRDMVDARLSPPGPANLYGATPFAFPATIKLEGLSALFDAQVCRRHGKYAVVSEKRLLSMPLMNVPRTAPETAFLLRFESCNHIYVYQLHRGA
jgi:hypothetical protein